MLAIASRLAPLAGRAGDGLAAALDAVGGGDAEDGGELRDAWVRHQGLMDMLKFAAMELCGME